MAGEQFQGNFKIILQEYKWREKKCILVIGLTAEVLDVISYGLQVEQAHMFK